MEASMTQLNRGKYKNKDAIEKEIRYISRTRKNETRQDELILYGTNHGYNYQKPVEEIIHELKRVQTMYGSRGSKLAHYCTKIYPKLFDDDGPLWHGTWSRWTAWPSPTAPMPFA